MLSVVLFNTHTDDNGRCLARLRQAFLLCLASVLAGLVVAPSVACAQRMPEFTSPEQALSAVEDAFNRGDPKRMLALVPVASKLGRRVYGEHDLRRASLEARLGSYLNHLHRNAEALSSLQLALSIFERAPKLPDAHQSDYVMTMRKLAFMHCAAGKLDDAEALYRKATDYIADAGMPLSTVDSDILVGLAEVMKERSEFVSAERCLTDALNVMERLPREQRGGAYRRVYVALSDLYDKLGDFERAERYRRIILTALEERFGPNHVFVAEGLEGLGLVLRHSHRSKEAIALYSRAFAIRKRQLGAGNPGLASSQHMLAAAFLSVGEFDEAYRLQTEAIDSLRQAYGDNDARLWPHLTNLGWIEMHRGNLARAEAHSRKSLRLTDQALGPQSTASANVVFTMGLIAALQGKYDVSHRYFMRGNGLYEGFVQAMSQYGVEMQKLSFMERIAGKTDMVLDFHAFYAKRMPEARDHAVETVLLRKGRVQDMVARNLDAIRKRATPEQLRILDRLQDNRDEMGRLVLQGLGGSRAKARYDALRHESEAMERHLGWEGGAPGTQKLSIRADDLCRRLEPGSALIEYAFFRHFEPGLTEAERLSRPEQCFVYVLLPSGRIHTACVGDSDTLVASVKALRTAIRKRDSTAYDTVAKKLFQTVLSPLGSALRGTKHLIIAPDGVLNLVPFGALIAPNGKTLIESHNVTYLTSGRELVRKSNSRPFDLTVFANPAYSPSAAPNGTPRSQLQFSPLPGTAREAALIKTLYPSAKVHTGLAADELTLKALSSPAVLHLATHGFFLNSRGVDSSGRGLGKLPVRPSASAPNVAEQRRALYQSNPLLKCGLAFAGANVRGLGGQDGILTGLEVSALDLENTKLVVLSACDTASGTIMNGAAVFGLRRAFTLAGAERLVMSLWPVHDDATALLMGDFYKGLKAGKGCGDALRDAQLKLMGDPRYSAPQYWAAFILGGDAGPISGSGGTVKSLVKRMKTK